jgi:hypothetical protein
MINYILVDRENRAIFLKKKETKSKFINPEFVFKNLFILFIKSLNEIIALINNFL